MSGEVISMLATGERVGEWLDVLPPVGEAGMLGLVEAQLDLTVIQRLLHLGFDRGEIDRTVLPARTLQHRRARGEKLTLEESDRVLRLLRVMAATEAVYGKRGRSLEWLRRENARLGGRTPISLLKTDVGSRMVEELLLQIDEGMFV